MEPRRPFRDRVRDVITTYGPTAVELAQLGLYAWYMLRHGSTA
jgi:hypothetical protein